MQSLLLAIFCAALGSEAAARDVDDWSIDTFPEGVYAATLNDSGNLLGQYCFTDKGSCVWMLGMKTACQSEQRYPILVNSDIGARTLEIYCGGQSETGHYRYLFASFDAIDNLVRGSSRIGFATPLQDDQFQVVDSV
jgi:hypothetical protein